MSEKLSRPQPTHTSILYALIASNTYRSIRRRQSQKTYASPLTNRINSKRDDSTVLIRRKMRNCCFHLVPAFAVSATVERTNNYNVEAKSIVARRRVNRTFTIPIICMRWKSSESTLCRERKNSHKGDFRLDQISFDRNGGATAR